jgi:hypothetical protein
MFFSDQNCDAVRGYVCACVLTITLAACAATDMAVAKNQLSTPPKEAVANQPVSGSVPDPPPKTPQGYIRSDVYQPEKYGGFRGDCAGDENFPFYWECMSENAGSDFQ